MRVIIAGGRDFGNRKREDGRFDQAWYHRCMGQVEDVMEALFDVHQLETCTVICGGANGADALGGQWGVAHHHTVEYFPAEWDQLGRKAGFVRNEQMACRGQILIAFWDGQSKGTRHMIDLALKHGLEVHVYRYDPIQTDDIERF